MTNYTCDDTENISALPQDTELILFSFSVTLFCDNWLTKTFCLINIYFWHDLHTWQSILHRTGSLSDGGNTMLSLPIQLVQLHDPGGESGGVRGSGGISGSQGFNGHIIIKNDPDGTRTLLLDPSDVGVSWRHFVLLLVVLVDLSLVMVLSLFELQIDTIFTFDYF